MAFYAEGRLGIKSGLLAQLDFLVPQDNTTVQTQLDVGLRFAHSPSARGDKRLAR